jgi:hypothetical protein
METPEVLRKQALGISAIFRSPIPSPSIVQVVFNGGKVEMVEFDSATEATAFAQLLQDEDAEWPWPRETPRVKGFSAIWIMPKDSSAARPSSLGKPLLIAAPTRNQLKPDLQKHDRDGFQWKKAPKTFIRDALTDDLIEEERADKFGIKLHCKLSGVPLGTFYPQTKSAVAGGGSPYVKNWNQQTMLHPVFSMSFIDCLGRARAVWDHEKSGSRNYSPQFKSLLFLALIHHVGNVRQDIPALPEDKLVASEFGHLIELLSWKHETGSARLTFPSLRIPKAPNPFGMIPSWLAACEVCKEDYENVVRVRQREAKQKASELALRNIKRSMYQDISLVRLWNWVEAQSDSFKMAENADLKLLFFADENKIQNWEQSDIEELEEFVAVNCELGNSISHEVMKRIKILKGWLSIYTDTFTVTVEDEEKFSSHSGQPEPQVKDYPNRAAYLVNLARWKLANRPGAKSPANGKGTSEEDI